MSKYRISFHFHRFSQRLRIALALLSVLALVTLPTHPISFPAWQGVLCASIISALLIGWKTRNHADQPGVVSVDENRYWMWLRPTSEADNGTVWTIGQRSRVTSFVLFVHLMSAAGTKAQSQWVWLLRTDMPERDFRRLCRIIDHRER